MATAHPDKLRRLIDLWWSQAAALGALPLDDRWAARSNVARGSGFRKRYTFYPGLERVDRIKAPDMTGRGYAITADVVIPSGGAEGVLLAFGTSLAGYVLYIAGGRLNHEYVFSGHVRQVVQSDIEVSPGRHELRYEFSKTVDGVGRGALSIDGAEVGTVAIPKTWPNRAVQGGLTCGRDSGLAISDRYRAPFKFTGTIHRVVVDLGEEIAVAAGPTGMAVWPPPHMA